VRTLLGANGAGKTTVLRALCGMVRTNGDIRFDGKSIIGDARFRAVLRSQPNASRPLARTDRAHFGPEPVV